jgi:sec-independent protein translocase protein TatA
MFGSLGFTELILILMIVLIIFGAGKLPQLGEGVGKAIKGFKKSVQEAEAYDVDPQVQADNSSSGASAHAPQISQTITPSPGTVPHVQPETIHSPQEHVAAPSKA